MTSLNHRTIAAAIAVAAALQLGLMKVVSAQNASGNEDWCPDKRFENMNATASYSVPGFSPPGENDVNGDSTWTFSTGAVAYDGNTTQRVWINTSPAIQVDSDSLPYQGCVLALFSLTKEAPAGKDQDNKDDGDCKSYLGEECVAAILKNSNAVAQNFSTQVDEDSQNFKKGSPSYFSFPFAQCSDFPIRAIPDECGDASQIYSTAAYIGHHPKIYANETLAKEDGFIEPSPCPDLGGGENSTAATSPLLAIYPAPAPNTEGYDANYSTYDQWLNRVLPVLVPVWSKDPKKGWSDTRLICMRPQAVKQEDTEGGSTTPATAQPTTSADSTAPAQSATSTPAQPGSGVRGAGYSREITFGLIFATVLLLSMIG